jgi:hypothetical protein
MSRYQDAILKALATPRRDFKPSDIPHNYLPAKMVAPIAFRHEILRLCEFRIPFPIWAGFRKESTSSRIAKRSASGAQ